MSRSAVLGLLLLAILIGGTVALVMLANSAAPPQRQVEQTIPDERLPK